MYILRKIFYPEIYQGRYKKKHYFEGWYFKLIDETMENGLAIIPGVSFERYGKDNHAFIQILKSDNTSHYIRYDLSEFQYSKDKFQIRIGDNYFSRNSISLNIKQDQIHIQGKLLFDKIVKLPKSLFQPGIMGPFSYIPFMECYHGVVNIHHEIRGHIESSGENINFNKGYGYIEKDWGKSFPEAWIWFQSNHFQTKDVTIMFSLAKIPWLHTSFKGFLSFFRNKDKVYVFATYTGAKIIYLLEEDNAIGVCIEDRKYRLEMKATYTNGGILKAPKNGLMNREITESIHGIMKVRLSDKKGQVLYEGIGTNTGVEIAPYLRRCSF